MAPDGQWLAYVSEGRLRLTQVAGGPVSTVGPFGKVVSIAWLGDLRHVAALQLDSLRNGHWSLIDVPSGERRPLWNRAFPRAAASADSVAVDPNRFGEIAWSSDGRRLGDRSSAPTNVRPTAHRT